MLRKLKKILHKAHFSLLDWIIVIASIAGVCVIGLLLFRKNEFKIITVKVGEDDVVYLRNGPRKWFANQFTVGMKEVSGLGKTEAEILQVFSYDSNPNYKNDSISYRKNVYLTVRIRTIYNRSSHQYIFKGKPVVIGSEIRMYLGSVLTDGLIVRIDGFPDTRIKKTVAVEAQIFGDTTVYPQTSGVRPYIADSLSSSDTVKDDQDNVQAKILDIRTEDAKQLTTTSDGRMLISVNPLMKDVSLTLEIYGFEQNGSIFMFDDIPILIDAVVPLHLPYIDLYPTITKILKVE